MLRLSKKMFCAVEAVLFIAYYGGAEPISGKAITARQKLPPRFLEQLLQELVKAGILRGVRGPKGGYVLARERRRITVGDICDVVSKLQNAQTTEEPEHTALGRAILMPLTHDLKAAMNESLHALDIASLCERAEALHIDRSGENCGDYII